MNISMLCRLFLQVSRRMDSSGLILCLLRLRVNLCKSKAQRLMESMSKVSMVYFFLRQVMKLASMMSKTKAVKRMMKVPQYEDCRYTQQVILSSTSWTIISLSSVFFAPILISFSSWLQQVLRYLSFSSFSMTFSPMTIFLKESSSLLFTLIQCVEKVVQLPYPSTIFAVSKSEGVSLSDPSFFYVSMQKRLYRWDGFLRMQILKIILQQFTSSGVKQKYEYLVVRVALIGQEEIQLAGSWQCSPMNEEGHLHWMVSDCGSHWPSLRQGHGAVRVIEVCRESERQKRKSRKALIEEQFYNWKIIILISVIVKHKTDWQPILITRFSIVVFLQLQALQLYFLMQGQASTIGKLLLSIYTLHQQKKISSREKGVLKDLVVAAAPSVLHVYELYQHDGTELTLVSDLKHLVRLQKDNETQENSSQDSIRPKRASITVKIPKTNIQKMSYMPNRI